MNILFFCLLLLVVAAVAMWLRFYRYRFVSFIKHGYTDDMGPFALEGYANKLFFYSGETIDFYIHSEFDAGHAVITPYATIDVNLAEFSFAKIMQPHTTTDSENGCHWTRTTSIELDSQFTPGYYTCHLVSADRSTRFDIHFIIGSRTPAKTVVLAPVGTWTAYNCWGGKSLYQNKYENKTVYRVSTQRPYTPFPVKNNLQAEENIFRWFATTYDDVAILPDFALETNPELFERCELLVLAYHIEYVSRAMYDSLLDILTRPVSMISLGANQLYWSVRWNADHTQMECHKDLTSFSNPHEYGGMWRHHLRFVQRIMGVGYNGAGMHTWAPYRVTNASHWLFEGTGVKNGDLFGVKGISNRPICGSETDMIGTFSGKVERIARGINCASASQGSLYDGDDTVWDGAGGGDFVLKYLPNSNAVLATASIESGAGLGVDPVFTKVIENFVKRYGPSGTG
ncbi:MAG: hypothetical protein JSS75_07835 [Bacteroidetes bacterium]|nr:hypothetical protein [Bacteroidota bacterium]